MRSSHALVLLAILLLPSCGKNRIANAGQAIPVIEDTAPAASRPVARSRTRVAPLPSGPAPTVPFRTPAVTNSLVDEQDLLRPSPGAVNAPGAANGESGTIIARPPASDSSE